MRTRRIASESTLFVMVAMTLAAVGCSSSAEAPGAPGDARPGPQGEVASAPSQDVVTTRATVSSVAGRIDDAKRSRVKDVVTRIVDGYLDGGFVGGDYPRDDFSAAFADFREGAASIADADLDLLTNHDIGTRVSAVTATHRRLRIDLLAPGGRPSAATARFVLALDTTGVAPGDPGGAQKVVGSLFLTNQQGAWRVFGYDVRKGAVS